MIETAIVVLIALLGIVSSYATMRMERARCLLIVASEPELPGPCPPEVRERLEALGFEGAHRMTVALTKQNIIRRIDAGQFPKNLKGERE